MDGQRVHKIKDVCFVFCFDDDEVDGEDTVCFFCSFCLLFVVFVGGSMWTADGWVE